MLRVVLNAGIESGRCARDVGSQRTALRAHGALTTFETTSVFPATRSMSRVNILNEERRLRQTGEVKDKDRRWRMVYTTRALLLRFAYGRDAAARSLSYVITVRDNSHQLFSSWLAFDTLRMWSCL